MDLKDLGWNEFFEKHFSEVEIKDIFPARIATAQREIYWIYSNKGEFRAEISGKLRFNTSSMSDLPAVGDWVAARLSPEGDLAIIEGILPRISKFSRKVAGGVTDEQGCAVRDVIEKGILDTKRFQNYIKLKKEIKYLATRKEKVKSRNEKIITEKKISKLSKQIKKHKRKYEF